MASKLTSAQIIALGEYLEPDFDPRSLTVSQLLGVLGYHHVTYPTPYSKPKLILRFEEEIRGHATKLKKERLQRANSIASDDGITDGLTGKPLGKPVRRSSRRLSKIPAATTTDEEEASPARPESTKRRRSSVQPVLAGTASHKKVPFEVNVIEESDSEVEQLPVKKVGRTKKAGDASSQARRVSREENSGWEDNNIFQSGAEDSSPARPPRFKASRKSTGPRKSRKSFSAPPQSPSESSPMHAESPQPQSFFQATDFKPKLPFVPTREFRLPSQSPPSGEMKQAFPDFLKEEAEEVEELPSFSESSPEIMVPVAIKSPRTRIHEPTEAISRRVAASVEAVRRYPKPPRAQPMPWSWRFILIIIFSIIAYHVHDYKVQSTAIGYCETGTTTSRPVEDVKTYRLLAKDCNRENRTTLLPSEVAQYRQDFTPCPLPPLLPLPQPESCTPCPHHASCTQFSVTCDIGYLLYPNAFVPFLPTPPSVSNISLITATSPAEYVWGALSDSLNGLPGLGSVALPPRCVEDPNRKRRIGALERRIEIKLGNERGSRLCAGGKPARLHVEESKGGEARKWGVEFSKLRETMKKKTPVKLLPAFDDTFNDSVQRLLKRGDVFIGEDAEGHRYLAHKVPNLTWDCALVVKMRDIWAEWKPTVFAIIATIAGVIVARLRIASARVESRRVAELVQIALDTLRNQEIAHHTDPVITPQPYLSSLQLRDLILQEEHSIPIRRRLWDQVENVVEGNANVRTNMEEVEGGDELRVWRWIGSGRGRRVENNAGSPYASPNSG